MRFVLATSIAVLSVSFFGCGGDSSAGPAPTPPTPAGDAEAPPPGSNPDAAPAGPLDLRLVFVHGVSSEDDHRLRADGALSALERRVAAAIDARRSAFEASAGRALRVTTARVNIYTDENGALVKPGLDDRSDGTGVPTADAWREQLAKKTNLAVGADAGNIVFVGHSTGARAAVEVTAGVGGKGGPGSRDWGFTNRVAGVVTVHGMIDALNSTNYDFVGPTSFVVGCRAGQGGGWCEYAGHISGVAALDWVARERHVLSLVGAGSCSPSLWSGVNDKSLPLAAESSPWSPGMTMTPGSGGTFVPAHGTFYGEFCHSDVTDGGSPRHEAAVTGATERIVTWLFDAAPRVHAGTREPGEPFTYAGVADGVFTPPAEIAGACADGRKESAAPPDVVGVCVHPGVLDGDDHPFDGAITVEKTSSACTASARFTHRHAGEKHDARLWMKVYSVPSGGGLLSTLR